MATTVAHGAILVTASLEATIGIFGPTPLAAGIGVALSAYTAYQAMKPDTIGIIGGSPAGNYELYVRAHQGDIAKRFKDLPWWRLDKWCYLFHLWWDTYFHRTEPPYGWMPAGYALEALQDIGMLTLLIWSVGIWWTIGIVSALGGYVLIILVAREPLHQIIYS